MRSLALAILLVSSLAHADDSFETRAQGAQRVRRIENVVWALTATCDKGNDTENRQCRRVRDTRAAELANATLLVDGDADAFDMTAFDAKKKSISMTLAPCIRCGGVEVEGKTYIVNGGTAKLYDNAKAFSDDAAAKAWTKSIGNARVQMLVKVPAKAVDGPGAKTVKLDIVGYRVYAPCDGAIVAANPPSGPAEADKKACRAVAAEPAQGPAVEQLTAAVVAEAMKPAVDAAQKCFEKYGVAGKAKLKLTVASDGTIARYEQQGDFASTPTGACIDKALEKARFPANGKPKTTIAFPITLQ
jgi:hypothetical protein